MRKSDKQATDEEKKDRQGEKLIQTRWEKALWQPRKPGSLSTHGAVGKTLVGAGHVIHNVIHFK